MKYAFALFILFAIAVPGLSHPKVASACSCIQRTPEEIFESVDAVFYGKAVSTDVRDMGLFISADVAVEKVWKGNVPQNVTVTTSGGSAGCGFDEIREDENMLFVARMEEGVYTLGLCDSLGVEDAEKADAYFGESSAPSPVTDSSSGISTNLSAILAVAAGVILGFIIGQSMNAKKK